VKVHKNYVPIKPAYFPAELHVNEKMLYFCCSFCLLKVKYVKNDWRILFEEAYILHRRITLYLITKNLPRGGGSRTPTVAWAGR